MKFSITALFITIIIFTNAQNYKYGKVSQEELEETSCPIENNAAASILYQNNSFVIDYNSEGMDMVREVQMRIKIYDKDRANKWLSQMIRLYNYGGSNETILSFKACTYNLENNSIEENSLKQKDGISEELSDYYNSFSFNFPNVKNGSVLEYYYQIRSPFISATDEVYFQYDIPLILSEFSFTHPEYFDYKLVKNGTFSASQNSTQLSNHISGYQAKETKIEFKNVPSRKKEEFVINDDNLREGVSFELASIAIPGRAYKNFTQSWQDVFKTLRDRESFGKQLGFESHYQKIVAPIVSGLSNNEDKAEKILNYIQQNIHWDGYYGIYSSNVKKAMNDKKGSVSDINLNLVNMFNAAGLEAYPVVLSSTGNGYVNPGVPTINKFNYVLAAVKNTGGYALYDATSPFTNMNILPKRALGLNGFVITKNNYDMIPIVNSNLSKEYYAVEADLSEGTIEGKCKRIVNNYFAITESEQYYSDKNEFLQDVKNETKADLKDLEVDREDDKLNTNFNFTYTNNVEVIGDKILFNPLLFLADETQIFNEEKRTQNIEFGSPFVITKSVAINIPDDYYVEDVPEGKRYVLVGDLALFVYNFNVQDKKLMVTSKLKIDQAVYSPNYYEALKEFYQKIIESETQYVSLVKK